MQLLNCPAGTMTESLNDSIFISNGTSAIILYSVLCGGPVFFNNFVYVICDHFVSIAKGLGMTSRLSEMNLGSKTLLSELPK
jgi:hypothetical protein